MKKTSDVTSPGTTDNLKVLFLNLRPNLKWLCKQSLLADKRSKNVSKMQKDYKKIMREPEDGIGKIKY